MTETRYPDPHSDAPADLDPATATTDRMVAMAHAHRKGQAYPTPEQLLGNPGGSHHEC